MSTSVRGKYRAKTLKEKVEILREVDAKNASKQDIAKKFGIPRSTLSTYIRNKKAIVDAYEVEAFSGDRKRLRPAKYPDLEKALVTWIKDMRSLNLPLSGSVIMAKAADFALRLEHDDFAASEGWFHRFRERHDLVFRAVSGEGQDTNMETCGTWKSGALQDYLRSYSPCDIFNADETALFFKLLPNKTITYKGDNCAGGKRSKERVTVMLAANMTGTEKLPIFVIGKSAKPRCFKNIRSLPTDYAANKKAWMTGALFEQWLRKLDKKFELRNRQVLLLVDNCSAHNVDIELKAIQLAFLPPNTTSMLQPMGQGVIKNMKTFYRRHLLERMILCSGNESPYNITLLTAMHMLVHAWDQVTAATIANCFRHCGFDIASSEATADSTATADSGQDGEDIPASVRQALQDVDFTDYVDADKSAMVCGALTDEEIIAHVRGGEPAMEDDDGEEENEEAPVRPCASEVMEALDVVRRFFSFEEDGEDAFRHVQALEGKVMTAVFFKKKQKKISDFFAQ